MRSKEGRTYTFKLVTTYSDYIITVWGYGLANAKHNALAIFKNRYDVVEGIEEYPLSIEEA